MENADPVQLAKHQASNLFELGLQMSQTALTYLQTVIKREKSKSGKRGHQSRQQSNDMTGSKAFSTLQQIKPEDLKSPKGTNASFKAKKGLKKLESDKKQLPHQKPSLEAT